MTDSEVPRPSTRGIRMIGAASRLFAKFKYGDIVLATDLDKILAQTNRQPPENACERMMWRNQHRRSLNLLGVNLDLIENRMPRKCKYGWQVDPVDATDRTGASALAYELRKVEDSILFKDQLQYAQRYAMAASERDMKMSAFLPQGDARFAIVKGVTRVASAVSEAYVTHERTRQRLLAAE